MSSKKTLKEYLDLLGIKKVLLLLLSLAIAIFVFIFSILNSIQNTQIIVNPSSSLSSPTSVPSLFRVLSFSGESGEVSILTTTETHNFKVALATTPQSRRTGLMDISSMDPDEGMLFIFPESQQLSFWMKNTYIPLDIIFIDEDLKIIKIHENAKPLDINIRYESGQPAKYALELNALTARTKNIKVGDKVELQIPR